MYFYTVDCILLSNSFENIFDLVASEDRDKAEAPHVDSQHLREAYWIFAQGM